MLFNSVQYAYFLPLVLLVYYACPRRLKLWTLLIASLLFYASWNAVYLILIVGLIVFNFFCGLGLGRLRERPRERKWLLRFGIAVDLGVLAFYKYSYFLITSVITALGWTGAHTDIPTPSVILPLGISFFTFEFLHYLIDVHRGKPVITSPLKFAIFASFFPTQIAGPIKRYEKFVPQLEKLAPFEWENIGSGLRMIVIGLFKKIALADNLAPVVSIGFGHVARSGAPISTEDAWIFMVAALFQIYFDYSGYTDIGRGSALMLGYRVPRNFVRPFLSTNMAEFWQRWNMSLSAWLRDYLYVPLGGNRRGRYRNQFLTMMLGGLWHGASWTFVIWGALNGSLLAGYWRIRNSKWQDWRKRLFKTKAKPLYAFVCWAWFFATICMLRAFFGFQPLNQSWSIVGSMLGWRGGGVDILLPTQRLLVLLVALGSFGVEGFVEWRTRHAEQPLLLRPTWAGALLPRLLPVGYAVLFGLTLLARPPVGPRFVYFQF